MVTRMFKLPEHSKFSYQPIYYDERKEERELKLQKIKTEGKIDASNIKGKFSYNSRIANKSNKVPNIRLYTILGVFIFTFVYITMNLQLIEKMLSVFF